MHREVKLDKAAFWGLREKNIKLNIKLILCFYFIENNLSILSSVNIRCLFTWCSDKPTCVWLMTVLWRVKSSPLLSLVIQYRPTPPRQLSCTSLSLIWLTPLFWMNFPPPPFFYEWEALTHFLCLWWCMQMNVWMERRRDWRTAPEAPAPSHLPS